ncbi:MAG: MATE family efflux transporter, partial [Melioribacteraceae bacterium]|nr:MATE family efflux transporter [Melioribacteraceae bacterium]
IYWGFGFLRMGTTGLTAQSFGSKNRVEVSSILFRAFFVSIAIGILLILLQYPIAELSLFLIDGSAEVEQFASEYYYIRIFAAPATLSLYALHGWFLGVQNSKYPLYIALFINILNIVLNLLFVYQLNMKVEGVAWATVIAQYMGLLFTLTLIFNKYRENLKLFRFHKIIEKTKVVQFLKVNSDIFFRTILLIFTISFFTAKSAEINNEILAANFILMQLWLIISYGVDGFAFAAESLVGKYFGARDEVNLNKTIRYSFLWGLSLGSFLSACYLVFGQEILSLYTNQENVIETAMIFIIWIIIAPVINSISFIWDGIYFGRTETKRMLFSMIISVLFVFIPIYYITHDYFGNHSIWFSLTAFMFVRGLTLTLFYKKVKTERV